MIKLALYSKLDSTGSITGTRKLAIHRKKLHVFRPTKSSRLRNPAKQKKWKEKESQSNPARGSNKNDNHKTKNAVDFANKKGSAALASDPISYRQ